ncbi:MAG: hypothetical protein H7837_12490 [Magnetococcus sp. MYC-9]
MRTIEPMGDPPCIPPAQALPLSRGLLRQGQAAVFLSLLQDATGGGHWADTARPGRSAHLPPRKRGRATQEWYC